MCILDSPVRALPQLGQAWARLDRTWHIPGSHKTGLRRRAQKPVKDLWKLDIATRHWSELEQYGTRPCARMMPHGATIAPLLKSILGMYAAGSNGVRVPNQDGWHMACLAAGVWREQ